MSRRSALSREVVIDVLKRLMVEIDDPTPLVIPEATDGLDDLGDFLEGLLSSSTPPSKSALPAVAPEPVSGTKPITIRLHKRVINAFKAEAARTGIRYQTLMHRALADAADGFAV